LASSSLTTTTTTVAGSGTPTSAALIKHAAWAHGLGVELEDSSWTALRQGFFTTIRPSNRSTLHWVHFVIPTPVILDGNRLRAVTAWIRYTTGSGAVITSFHVYDGETKIANYNGLSLRGISTSVNLAVPNSPLVYLGTGISVLVDFSGTGFNDYIQFISGGIDFY